MNPIEISLQGAKGYVTFALGKAGCEMSVNTYDSQNKAVIVPLERNELIDLAKLINYMIDYRG